MGLAIKKSIGKTDVQFQHIQFDSRKVAKKDLFVAVKGTVSDGHTYINKAIEQGAIGIICETVPEVIDDSVCYLQVENSAKALGILASNYYDAPSKKCCIVGITGTNGKTSIATLLYQLFQHLGNRVGLISTVENRINDTIIPSTHTTPDALSLQALIAEMHAANCAYIFMEVSSHAIDQDRISGIDFNFGLFTNLSHDHLDYHKSMEAYLKVKKQFFDKLPHSAIALSNFDDRNGEVMLQNTRASRYSYATQTIADYKGKVFENSFEGMLMEINGKEVSVPFSGKFNASNLTAVYGTACLLGVSQEDALVGLSCLKSVAGRFEIIPSPKGYFAIVDYAHTPDALKNVLENIKVILRDNGNTADLVTVVGCGGDRDKSKRPKMAKIAARESNRLILTADNPRFEEPSSIIQDMLEGLNPTQRNDTLVIEERLSAIKTACALANKGDVILVAGKGHEDYQDIQGVKHHFDDKETLIKLFKNQTT